MSLRKGNGCPETIPVILLGRPVSLLASQVWTRLVWFRHNIGNIPGGARVHPTFCAVIGCPLKVLVASGPIAPRSSFADRLMPCGHLLAIARKPGLSSP